MNQLTLKNYCANVSKRVMFGLASTSHIYPRNRLGQGHYVPVAYNSRNILTLQLRNISPEYLTKVSSSLNQLSMWAGLSQDTPMRMHWSGQRIMLEIPKPSQLRQAVTIEELEQKHLIRKGPVVTLGLGMQDEPIRIDFRQPNLAHVFVVGQTRSGKTNTQRFMGWNIVKNSLPNEGQMLIFDVAKKGHKWDIFNGVPNLLHPVIIDIDTAISALKRIILEINTRAENKVTGPKWFIIIDELKALIDANNDVVQMLAEIASVGGEFGIHLILATQYPQISMLKDPAIKRNITTRLCGRVDDAQASSNALGIPDAGAEKLTGYGDFLYKDSEYLRRVSICKIEDSHLQNLEHSDQKTLDLEHIEVGTQMPKPRTKTETIDSKALTIALFEDLAVNKLQEKIRDSNGSLSAERGMYHRKLAQEIRKWAAELGYDCLH